MLSHVFLQELTHFLYRSFPHDDRGVIRKAVATLNSINHLPQINFDQNTPIDQDKLDIFYIFYKQGYSDAVRDEREMQQQIAEEHFIEGQHSFSIDHYRL